MPRPLVFLVITSGLLLFTGCAVVSANRTFPKLDWYWSKDAILQREERKADAAPPANTPAMSHAARIPASVPARAAVKPFGLAWESVWTQDGEITGIESSTDLVHWQVETQWTMKSDWPASVIVSNKWADTQPGASQKFYRAFNRGP